MAFRFSVDKLFQCNPVVTMWTFTFATTPWNDKQAMELWRRFMGVDVVREWPLVRGLRVAELHKRELHFNCTHGIHFHALLNMRLPVERVKLFARRHGFGLIDCRVCDNAGAGYYLSKYLWKDDEMPFGCRRWGVINGFRACKVRDVEYETEFTRNRAVLFGKTQTSFKGCVQLRWLTDLWGPVFGGGWPVESFCELLDAEFQNHPQWTFTVEYESGGRAFGRKTLRDALLTAVRGRHKRETVRIYRQRQIVLHLYADGEIIHVRDHRGRLVLTRILVISEARRGLRGLRQRKSGEILIDLKRDSR